ncbi:MAG: hypothetical protein C5B49_14595 [Bdellovibrio sp.]|nr:MAG: hypothetical protein C5B49_14595 [Bdellovibrio sp.]
MATRNPVFNEKTIEQLRHENVGQMAEAMTVHGAINKTGILLILTVIGAALSWSHPEISISPLGLGIVIGNLILGFVIIFNRARAPLLAPIYAFLEGLLLGGISELASTRFPGVVANAMTATFGILAGMLVLYNFGILRATETFKKVLSVAMIGVVISYVVNMVSSAFGHVMPYMHEGSPMSLIFSGFVIVVASLCFISDFDMIERAAQAKAPKYMEWYAGFSVLLTIIWLYLEILRLLGRRR